MTSVGQQTNLLLEDLQRLHIVTNDLQFFFQVLDFTENTNTRATMTRCCAAVRLLYTADSIIHMLSNLYTGLKFSSV